MRVLSGALGVSITGFAHGDGMFPSLPPVGMIPVPTGVCGALAGTEDRCGVDFTLELILFPRPVPRLVLGVAIPNLVAPDTRILALFV